MPLPAFTAVKSAEIAIFGRRVENSNTLLQNVLGGCWASCHPSLTIGGIHDRRFHFVLY